MDGRGRIAESLIDGLVRAGRHASELWGEWQRAMRRWSKPLVELEPPRGVGTAATALFFLGTAVYGAACGGHVPTLLQELRNFRDATANAFGFRIEAITITGQYQLTEAEILAAAGVTPRSSLLFLDAAAARAELLAKAWIADATVLKLYPGRLHIAVTEREPFALWQRDGKVAVIDADGIVLETVVPMQFASLPLVVGRGADRKAKDFLAILDKFPALRAQVYASVLVAERRWNLKLKNGIDVRLPENGVESALQTLAMLDRDKKLLSRDIVAVDLRLADRVTVKLSEGAALAREEAMRERLKDLGKKPRRPGGHA
ncbi:MAG TPA: cell division protein FtsQ/DivIB [Xanthobacteraceae bacterium]|nr:cell division protein FtsQ/DivIB [Xanthobacteraceae bacterium]